MNEFWDNVIVDNSESLKQIKLDTRHKLLQIKNDDICLLSKKLFSSNNDPPPCQNYVIKHIFIYVKENFQDALAPADKMLI